MEELLIKLSQLSFGEGVALGLFAFLIAMLACMGIADLFDDGTGGPY